MKRDLVSFASWNAQELSDMFLLATKIKSGDLQHFTPLVHKSAALIFEKQSLRTRVSFEVGIAQLGGHPVFLQQETIGIATRESVHDVASVLSHYNELIIARTTKHQTVVQLAESATVPVINAMTDLVHPCQVLADYFTLQEIGKSSASTKLVFVGDGNNVVNSLLELAEKLPIHLVISSPTGYEPHPNVLEQAEASGISKIQLVPDPFEAVKDADVIYTDVWPTARDSGRRQIIFKQHQVNAQLLKNAKPDCVVMHRLPANRGEEITRDVLDGKHSIVLQQAENRLHIQKGVIAYLLGHRP
ncbi:MAG: ornithine carbamoyltransferase [Bacteroidetes bacterium]|nr:ornithine carbamoyltransferase [Bacteroidota bacterium]MCW5895874.1 ornithine carbamoyltransferase [Bacteroidota bacterium]